MVSRSAGVQAQLALLRGDISTLVAEVAGLGRLQRINVLQQHAATTFHGNILPVVGLT